MLEYTILLFKIGTVFKKLDTIHLGKLDITHQTTDDHHTLPNVTLDHT